MIDRLEWRRAVRKSRLPGNVKVTLLTHADPGGGRWHDDQANLHAFSREQLADTTGRDERTIARHLRLAENLGWLKRHGGGYHGMQAEFHYTTPGGSEPCRECSERVTERVTQRVTKSDPEGRPNPALKGDKNPAERVTSLAPFERPGLSPLRSTPDVTTGQTAERSAATSPDHQSNFSSIQASFKSAPAAASPATKASPVTDSGPNATTVGVTNCACGGQLVGLRQGSSGLCGPCLLKAQATEPNCEGESA